MIILLYIFLLLLIIYLYLVFPNLSRKEKLKPYHERYICHRGFFNNQDIPENSLIAFKKAVENNYGIELDLQITQDDKIVVFHDTSLKRMTGIDKDLIDCTYDELQDYHLLDTDEKIPLFTDVLKILKKDTPLIVEIKDDGRYLKTTQLAIEILKDYDGLYNMESFHPTIVNYIKKNAPEVIRGQLSYNYLKDENSKASFITKFMLTNMLYNFLSRPDYIAYDCNNYRNFSFQLLSHLFKSECVAWTVKSQKQLEQIKKHYQCFIFDTFVPEEKD